MGARYRWGTALGVAVAVAAGGGGTLYLVKEWQKESGEAHDDALGADASADASVARGKGKGKAGKRGARGGKPRGGSGRIGTRSGGATAGGGNAGGGNGGGGNAGGDNGGAVDHGGDDDDDSTDTEERKPPPFRGRGPAGPTYEAAIASNTQEIAIGKQGAPDLADAQISGPMRNGAFVGECGAPDSMKVTVQVAIKMGRPAGVSVSTSPPDPDVAGCIDRYVRTFSWPSSPKMDSFKTTY
ncbi:hypothetical protein BH11MYX4_BH11MYX4_50730 [soil metagenome]